MTIVIPKPNKASYDSPKTFCPIILFNTLGKLIKKVISNRLQFKSIASGFIYSNQLGGLRQQSTIDADIFLTHFIWAGWINKHQTSVLAFDIVQFFPSLDHDFLTKCIAKAGYL